MWPHGLITMSLHSNRPSRFQWNPFGGNPPNDCWVPAFPQDSRSPYYTTPRGHTFVTLLWLPCIPGHTTRGIDYKLGRYIQNDTHQARLMFGHLQLHPCPFQASWFSYQLPCIYKHMDCTSLHLNTTMTCRVISAGNKCCSVEAQIW